MVRAQAMLLDHLGIDSLFGVIGGSMGGMLVLQWAAAYPERVFSAIVIAAAAKHSAQNIAFHEVGRQAIMADPDWRGGRYIEAGTRPSKGLAVARMAAHITYLSEGALQRKFGRSLQDRAARTFTFDADFQIESYLRHQGMSFVDRFDANSYLYVTRAMDYFDLADDHGGALANAFKGTRTRFCVASFTSDWLFPTSDSRQIVHALNAAGAARLLRRDRHRQGPRRFSPRHPRAIRDDARIPRRGGARAGARMRFMRHRDTKTMAATPLVVADGAAVTTTRLDLLKVSQMVAPGSRVLDVGCGDGELLALLRRRAPSTAAASSSARAGSMPRVGRGLAVVPGRRRLRPRQLSR